MRKFFFLSTIALAALVLSCNQKTESKDNSKHILKIAEVVFNKGTDLTKLFTAYEKVSEALVNTDYEAAKKASEDMLKKMDGSNDVLWGEVKPVVKQMASSFDVEELRKYFYNLNMLLETPLRESLVSGEIYMQYCPMAFDDTGAYWFATDKTIMNPYFGDVMLHCGEVKTSYK